MKKKSFPYFLFFPLPFPFLYLSWPMVGEEERRRRRYRRVVKGEKIEEFPFPLPLLSFLLSFTVGVIR